MLPSAPSAVGRDNYTSFVILNYFLCSLCFCVSFPKVKMVLIDQKSDQKNAATVANHSDRAITSRFI